MKTASQMPSGVLTSVSVSMTGCSRCDAVPVAAAANPAAIARKSRRDRPGDVASWGLRSPFSLGIGGFRLLGWPCKSLLRRTLLRNSAPLTPPVDARLHRTVAGCFGDSLSLLEIGSKNCNVKGPTTPPTYLSAAPPSRLTDNLAEVWEVSMRSLWQDARFAVRMLGRSRW